MIKSKPCTVDGCGYPRFAKGYCRTHQYLRTDKKKPKPIKARSDKYQYGQKDLFCKIWLTRPPKSFITGYDLSRWGNGSMFFSLFAHVLPKGKYPELKLKEENIVLLTPNEHALFDQGTEEKREEYARLNPTCDWEKLYDYREVLKKKFGV